MHKILIFFLIIPLMVLAQFKTQTQPLDFSEKLEAGQTEKGTFGILGLDPSRFSMHHSYSMSYMSMGGKGFTQGLYLNTMTYQFSIPLTLSLQLGIANQPIQTNNTAPLLKNGPFISGAQLQYKPAKNMIIQLDFQQTPYQNYPMFSNPNYFRAW